MSFDRYLLELRDLEKEIVDLQGSRNDPQSVFGQSFDENRLEELLEDLTDYARSNGNGALVSKLASLKSSGDPYVLRNSTDLSEVLARTLRIIRVLETFGREFLTVPIDKPPALLGDP